LNELVILAPLGRRIDVLADADVRGIQVAQGSLIGGENMITRGG
jgi:hypothetical protein